jgi:hypothetical protein
MTKKQKQQGVFHAPLKPKDTATQTKGCRHTNPSICGSNSLPEVCAFVREDEMCLKPPKSWPKQFERLKGIS